MSGTLQGLYIIDLTNLLIKGTKEYIHSHLSAANIAYEMYPYSQQF
jgi:hypothetical protein